MCVGGGGGGNEGGGGCFRVKTCMSKVVGTFAQHRIPSFIP